MDIASEGLLANFDTSGLRAGRGENCGEEYADERFREAISYLAE